MLFSLLNTDVSKYYTEEIKVHNFDQNGQIIHEISALILILEKHSSAKVKEAI